MHVVERFEQAKKPTSPSDDVIVVTDRVLAVIDGVSDKSGLTYLYDSEVVSSGRFAALTVAVAVEEAAAKEMLPLEMVEHVSAALADAIQGQRPGTSPVDWPGCAIVAYLPYAGGVWRVGDCQWRHGSIVHDESKSIDVVTSQMRAAVNHAALASGMTVDEVATIDPGRDTIMNLLRQQARFANTPGPFGYGVINGTPVPEQFIEIWPVPVTGADVLVLASDGYPVLAPTLGEAEAELARLLSVDPLCIDELRGTKPLCEGANSFDDRAWVSTVV